MGKSLNKVDDRWYFVNVKSPATERETSSVYDIQTGEKVKRDSALYLRARDSQSSFALGRLYDPENKTSAGNIPRGEWERWQRIASALDDGTLLAPIEVPITPLRDLLDDVRHTPKEARNALVEAWIADPASLAQRFRRSVLAFDAYENEDQAFHSRAGDQGTASLAAEKGFAARVAHEAHAGRLVFEGIAAPLRYVDHEVSPRRTAKSKRPVRLSGEFVDKVEESVDVTDERRRNKSGAGGIDLLLTDGAAVVVGEIKAETDTDLSTAVVQSLAYAAELATESQRRRLVNNYPPNPNGASLGFLETADEDVTAEAPWLEIAILYQPKEKDDLALAAKLSRALLTQQAVSSRVRQIRFFSSTDGVHFSNVSLM